MGVWFFFSSRRRHTRWTGDWSSDVCSSDLAANLAAGTPSKTRRDFFLRQRAQQTPFRESVRGCGCTKSRCRRFPSHGCSLAGPAPQSSANKEQGLRNYERKKSRDLAAPEYSGRAFKVAQCGITRSVKKISNRRNMSAPATLVRFRSDSG